MKTLALIPQTNKFVVEGYRWRFTKSRSEFIAQKIRHTISVFKGEWFLDKKIGIPYIPTEDEDANMHRRMIETALQVRIGEIDGVDRFLSFSSTLDKATRILRIDFTVLLDTGGTYSDYFEVGG